MAQQVQILRSAVTATPTTMLEGELAYSEPSDTLFYCKIGGSSIIPIAGPGTFAKLASPAFTGNPTVPNQSANNNSTRAANTAYVDAAVAAAGGSSVWGGITGTLSNQTDLQAALDAKAPLASPALTGNPTTPNQSAGNNSTRIANTAYVDTGLALKADLASPTFTGTPAAPTASAGTNTTQLATTAFVAAAVAALLNSAPGVLDTLDELAAALGDDPNFATTITTLIGTKLAISSNLSDLANAGTARTNLGLGSIATQAASAVTITGGTINGCTIDAGTF